MLPPQTGGGDECYLELRRNHGYDAALSVDGATVPPVALVIRAVSQVTGRVVYEDRIALAATPGDIGQPSVARSGPVQ